MEYGNFILNSTAPKDPHSHQCNIVKYISTSVKDPTLDIITIKNVTFNIKGGRSTLILGSHTPCWLIQWFSYAC